MELASSGCDYLQAEDFDLIEYSQFSGAFCEFHVSEHVFMAKGIIFIASA